MEASLAQTMTTNSVGGGKTALIVTSRPTVIVAASRSTNGRLFVTVWTDNAPVANLANYEDCTQFKGGVLSGDTEFEIDVIGDRLIVRQSDEE
jgi:hypothetical protein